MLRAGVRDRLSPPRPDSVAHVPFGTFCHIASLLRDTGLRRWTGPFDWIFSTPGLLADCLDDDFAAFLDPAHLRSVPEAELTGGAKRQCRHLLFEERYGLPVLFNHHDPVASASDRESFERAVSRFRTALRSGRTVLYSMSERRWPEAEWERLAAALARYPDPMGTRGAPPIGLAVTSPAMTREMMRLVVVTVEGGKMQRSWRTEERRIGDVPSTFVDVGTLTRSIGVRFQDPEDDAYLRRILPPLARAMEQGLRPAV